MCAPILSLPPASSVLEGCLLSVSQPWDLGHCLWLLGAVSQAQGPGLRQGSVVKVRLPRREDLGTGGAMAALCVQPACLMVRAGWGTSQRAQGSASPSAVSLLCACVEARDSPVQAGSPPMAAFLFSHWTSALMPVCRGQGWSCF